jgi:hypothetical protein
MKEHVAALKELGLPVPEPNPYPTVTIQEEWKPETVAIAA